MTEQKLIKVKNVDACIAIRLSEIAKQNGYQNREDFLRDLFKKIAFEEFHLETELRYKAFTMEAIETMHQGMELMVREFFLPALEMTKRGAKIDE